jgi:hypothetical protein
VFELLDSVLSYAESGEGFDFETFQSFVPSYEQDINALLPPEEEGLPVVNRASEALVEAASAELLALVRGKSGLKFDVSLLLFKNLATDLHKLNSGGVDFFVRSDHEVGRYAKIYEPVKVEQSQLFDNKSSWKNEPFSPSKQLLDFIHIGIAEHAKYLNTEANAISDNSHQKSAGESALFNNILSDMFSRIAFRTLDKVYSQSKITSNKKFELVFQHALMDCFPIVPLELEKFQTRLRRELIDYLECEGEFGGRWGKIAVRGGELEFVLEAAPLRGTEVEGDWDFAISDD